jgi:glycine betaine/proline transport system ATP-binding protein
MEGPAENPNLAELAQETPTVQPDDSLEEILPTSLEQPYPLPVVDEEGDFHGVVSRQSMISVLSENGTNDTEDREDCAAA